MSINRITSVAPSSRTRSVDQAVMAQAPIKSAQAPRTLEAQRASHSAVQGARALATGQDAEMRSAVQAGDNRSTQGSQSLSKGLQDQGSGQATSFEEWLGMAMAKIKEQDRKDQMKKAKADAAKGGGAGGAAAGGAQQGAEGAQQGPGGASAQGAPREHPVKTGLGRKSEQ